MSTRPIAVLPTVATVLVVSVVGAPSETPVVGTLTLHDAHVLLCIEKLISIHVLCMYGLKYGDEGMNEPVMRSINHRSAQ